MRDNLAALMQTLTERNAEMSRELSSSGGISQKVTEDVGRLITSIQFQDRTSQRLQNIKATLGTLGDAGAALSDETKTAGQSVGIVAEADEEWLRQIVGDRTLGEMRRRFVMSMFGEETTDADQDDAKSSSADADDDNDIELF